jgi:hypothetical protein
LLLVGHHEVQISLRLSGREHVTGERRQFIGQAGEEFRVPVHPGRLRQPFLDRLSRQQQRLLGQNARERLEILRRVECALARAGDFLEPDRVRAITDSDCGHRDALIGNRFQYSGKVAGLRQPVRHDDDMLRHGVNALKLMKRFHQPRINGGATTGFERLQRLRDCG